MAPTELFVFQSQSCNQACLQALLRDIIEEKCGGARQVEAASCLNHCEQGPNIEVTKKGKTRIATGIMTFKKMKALIEDNVRDEGGVHLMFAQLMLEARHEEALEAKMAKMEEAFQLLGGEETSLDDDDSESHSLSLSHSDSDSDSESNSDSDSDSDSEEMEKWWQKATEKRLDRQRRWKIKMVQEKLQKAHGPKASGGKTAPAVARAKSLTKKAAPKRISFIDSSASTSMDTLAAQTSTCMESFGTENTVKMGVESRTPVRGISIIVSL
ncbi:unnamed protein product [Polarella glacialis]|uniref:Uncharacterized protein n=1 Tax=Polarella glacialis TaxID=89957 RepID=A0A813IIH8_POLGL|nr:unnamed protein product [Polarella glacialis]